ncbi:hypothetical protein BBOV_II005890 [Babesia bovis T2Bo]|uniref:hypothetical protein n=1 Tax=Babesia bovis T2Bo TaxID=484906 RepID=UPI001C368F06|nr:hypothetical protein BBOV_II005890 [Babesia bovis T2Bo]EDO06539.2 hypothetical protein BBOV_II005890 [Babesia bovis T2Bo]
MDTSKHEDFPQSEIVKSLRNIIKYESLEHSNLLSIRNELAKRHPNAESYFETHKEEINGLIVDVLKCLHSEGELSYNVKSEVVETSVKVENDANVPISTMEKVNSEPNPKVTTSTSDAGEDVEQLAKRARKNQSSIMTREEFSEKAHTITVQIENTVFKVPSRVFSTGSCGWGLNERVTIEVDGRSLICQVGLNCTVVGSKSWKP